MGSNMTFDHDNMPENTAVTGINYILWNKFFSTRIWMLLYIWNMVYFHAQIIIITIKTALHFAPLYTSLIINVYKHAFRPSVTN